jgi:hypothetical protein
VYGRFPFPGTTVVGRGKDERVHLALEDDLRGDGRRVPLQAVVFLRTSNQLRSERIGPREALRDLWALSLKLPEEEDRARCFHGLVQLTASVPIWNFYRPLTYSELPTVVRELAGLCSTS